MSRLFAGLRRTSWPVRTFAGVEVFGLIFYLVLGRTQWFYADEWEFLAGRTVDEHGLLGGHFGHWVTLPVLVYRGLWQLFGLNTYVPYVALSIAVHLVVGALLRTIMVRSGVRPWTATTLASVFVLFGAGAQDIIWGFQISFTGALALGLVQLLLADHDGPIDKRDFLGIGAGLLALMCSNVAVTMIIAVGIATLLKRSWRVAALHTIPLGVIYVAWWERYATNHETANGTARGLLTWFTTASSSLFGGLGEIPGFGWLLGVLLVAGLVLFVRQTGWRELRERASIPIALAFGAIAFVGGAGLQRGDLGASFARQGRYVHVLAALLLPALALALDALLRRWRALGIIGLAALVIGIPGNLLKADSFAKQQRGLTASTHQLFLAIPRLPLAQKVLPTIRPEPDLAASVTVGWLLSGAASGRIPKPRPVSSIVERTNNLRLSLVQTDGRAGLEYPCKVLSSFVTVTLNEGDKFGIRGTVSIVLWNGTIARSLPVRFGSGTRNSTAPHTLTALAGPLQLKVSRGAVGFAFVCLKAAT